MDLEENYVRPLRHPKGAIIGIISVVLTLAMAPACNEEPTVRTVGECNEVATGQGCLQIQATPGFDGYVRVLALEEKIRGNLLGTFFELPGNQSIESGMTAGHYRVEGFTDSQRPKVDAEPDCSGTVEVRVGVGTATTVEPDDKDGCQVAPPG